MESNVRKSLIIDVMAAKDALTIQMKRLIACLSKSSVGGFGVVYCNKSKNNLCFVFEPGVLGVWLLYLLVRYV